MNTTTDKLAEAFLNAWGKNGDKWSFASGFELAELAVDVLATHRAAEKAVPVASIYISENGEREFDDWKVGLPIGRNILYSSQPAAPEGWKLVRSPITEEMHVAACKVLHRAPGLDGLPQRMLDAMLASSPLQASSVVPAEPAVKASAVGPEQWLPMESAPKDGSLLRLLVEFTEHATEDQIEPSPTIGSNSLKNTGIDEWLFAGWCWTHDCFTQGEGKPVGWLPMTGATPTSRAGSALPDSEERKPLSEEQLVKCLVEAHCVGIIKMSFESGPYDITRPSINADRLARAIERELGIGPKE